MSRASVFANFDELGIQDVVDLLRGEEADLPEVLRDFGNRAPGEDPVIHFYEHFLSAYNKKLKIQRGVFYTPRPVVSYIVRSVHELLQKEFGLEDGLASIITWGEMIKLHPEISLPQGVSPKAPFVVVLDPATGTATFLVEVIDVVYKTMKAKWKKQGYNDAQIKTAWNEYVPKHLLPRLYGYELMMAPYAIAHMKVGLKLYETGYRFGSDERVRIYLTNSLEKPSPLAEQSAASLFEALGHEALAVNDVKRKVKFTIIIGNPPYAKNSANRTENAEKLVLPYKNLVRNEANVQPLSDDYIKFLALSMSIAQENSSIVAMITNRSFVEGLIHRGLREILAKTCKNIQIIDLHGDSNVGENPPKGLSNENVFDITQGVAISIFLRLGYEGTKKIEHVDIWGTRIQKYEFLDKKVLVKGDSLVLNEPYFFFRNKNLATQAEQLNWISITDLFKVYGMGLKSRRDHFLIDLDKDQLIKRFHQILITKDIEKLRNDVHVTDNPQWTLENMQTLVKKEGINERIFPLVYRPFDIRYIWYHRDAIERGDSRWPIMKNLLQGDISLLTSRQSSNADFTSAFVVRGLSEMKTAESSRGSYVFPVFLLVDEPSLDSNQRVSNINTKSLMYCNIGDNPLDALYFIYAILYSPSYRKRYAGALSIEFPRIPNKCSIQLANKLIRYGSELVSLHLLESPLLNKFINKFNGINNTIDIGYPKYKDRTIFINEGAGFTDVPDNVWEFHIGGYQVCEKWLKYRCGHELSPEDIVYYQKIVVALKETIRLMDEVDEAIESAGGWPIR